jgi:type I restriction enzyme, R subunit
MGWEWIEGDVDVPELTEPESFRQVILVDRLKSALARINLRNGQSWLDESRINKAVQDLERAAGHRLMEITNEFICKTTSHGK